MMWQADFVCFRCPHKQLTNIKPPYKHPVEALLERSLLLLQTSMRALVTSSRASPLLHLTEWKIMPPPPAASKEGLPPDSL